jgi:hypothetical protein
VLILLESKIPEKYQLHKKENKVYIFKYEPILYEFQDEMVSFKKGGFA